MRKNARVNFESTVFRDFGTGILGKMGIGGDFLFCLSDRVFTFNHYTSVIPLFENLLKLFSVSFIQT